MVSPPTKHTAPVSAAPTGDNLALASFIGKFAAIAATLLSCAMGVEYWLAQSNPIAAAFVVVFEAVALASLPLAVRHGWRRWGRALAALVLLVLATLWCGLSNWRRLEADAAARAVQALQASPEYGAAQRALEAANRALEAQFAQTPPTCACPATLAAWPTAHERQLLGLQRQQARAAQALAALDPARQFSLEALFAPAIEFLKLVGLLVFSLEKPPPRIGSPVGDAPSLGRTWRPALFGLGMLGAQSGEALCTSELATAQAALEAPEIVQAATRTVQRQPAKTQATAWARAGVRKTEIARRLGVHRNTVHNWLRRAPSGVWAPHSEC